MFSKQFGQKRSLYVAIRYGMTGKCLFERFLRCPFHYPKVPLETGAPPSFDASYAPVVTRYSG